MKAYGGLNIDRTGSDRENASEGAHCRHCEGSGRMVCGDGAGFCVLDRNAAVCITGAYQYLES